jgi:hypothetical protein
MADPILHSFFITDQFSFRFTLSLTKYLDPFYFITFVNAIKVNLFELMILISTNFFKKLMQEVYLLFLR